MHIQVEEVKSYETFSSEKHSATDEQNNFILTELDDEEQSFVLELSSDSDLSDDELCKYMYFYTVALCSVYLFHLIFFIHFVHL